MADQPTIVIDIDADETNQDWIKWRSRESELAIHEKIAEELAKDKQRKAVLEAKATVLEAQMAIKGGKRSRRSR